MTVELFLAEVIGTSILILLGDGVVAGVLLAKTKANALSTGSGWIVITMGWGLAVGIAVYAVGGFSGAHINPAVTLGVFLTTADFGVDKLLGYWVAQMSGAFIGAVLVYLHYLPHWEATENADLKLAVFSTGPAIRNTTANFISEFIGTFFLVFAVFAIGGPAAPIAPLVIGFLIVVIGLSLGGTTGYAINPARDLGPRIAHFLLPIAGKRDSDWQYSWIPVVAPLVGGAAGALAYQALFTNFIVKAAGG